GQAYRQNRHKGVDAASLHGVLLSSFAAAFDAAASENRPAVYGFRTPPEVSRARDFLCAAHSRASAPCRLPAFSGWGGHGPWPSLSVDGNLRRSGRGGGGVRA